nr:MAG TPA: hypothetical protein [Crassvirales sp.]
MFLKFSYSLKITWWKLTLTGQPLFHNQQQTNSWAM